MRDKVEEQILQTYPSLYRLAFTYVKNPDDAMDIVQESVCKAIAGAPRLREEGAIQGWLCRIVVNASLDFLRSKKQVLPLDLAREVGREDVYQDTDLLRALDRLEERERTVVVLRFFQEQKLQEIARITGEKENTVKTILYRSLKKLRGPLAEGERHREGKIHSAPDEGGL